jgi:hypothetical protein
MPQHSAERGIDLQKAAVEPDSAYAAWRMVEYFAEARIALTAFSLGIQARADVMRDGGCPNYIA